MLRTLYFRVFRISLSIVILLLALLTLGQANEIPTPEAIICKISSKQRVWQQNKPSLVVIELTNETKKAFNIKVIPELLLRPIDSPKEKSRGYWSPVDILENHTLRTKQEMVAEKGLFAIMAQPIDLHRKANTNARYEVDASATKWEKQISSLWPQHALFDAVPTGKYILSMEMESKEYGRANISCGETQIEIAASSKK